LTGQGCSTVGLAPIVQQAGEQSVELQVIKYMLHCQVQDAALHAVYWIAAHFAV